MSKATRVEHPLIQRHLSQLRDIGTTPEQFRLLARRLAVLLAYEATQDLQLKPSTVTTPLATMQGAA
ncbi:MAG: uracil phosphoribosyltransferase, partial [Planctomycetales bacterium]|nr:uracil phosphoribosyltransferase [Planctomycetales bacterium]